MEDAQRRVKKAVDELITEIDVNRLRALQRTAFECSARCFDRPTDSREKVENCIKQCNGSTDRAHVAIERELNTLQDQLSRCALSCWDKFVQKNGPDPQKYDDATKSKMNSHMDECSVKCADDHLKVFPTIKQRLLKDLK